MDNIFEIQGRQLEERLRPDTPHRQGFADTIRNVTGLRGKLAAERARINGDRRFSAEGKADAMAAATKAMTRDFLEMTRSVRRARSYTDAQTTGIKMNPGVTLDRSDPVAEMRRAEVRAFLRGVPASRRLGAAMELASDPVAADAILDAPAVLSGLPPEQYRILKDQRAEQLHGPRLAELEAMSEDIASVEAVAGLAYHDLQRESGMPRDQFERFLDPVKQEVDGR